MCTQLRATTIGRPRLTPGFGREPAPFRRLISLPYTLGIPEGKASSQGLDSTQHRPLPVDQEVQPSLTRECRFGKPLDVAQLQASSDAGAAGVLVLGCLPDGQETFPLALAAASLVFCGLGYPSFGVLHLPAALALMITALGVRSSLQRPAELAPQPFSRVEWAGCRRFRMKRFIFPPLIAHALAWAAFFGVVFWPEGYGGSTRSADELRITFFFTAGPFRQYLGFEEIMLLLVPVALTGLAIWLAWPRQVQPAWAKPALWGLGVLCLAYCCIWFIEGPRQALWSLGVFCLAECSAPSWEILELGIEFIGAFYLPAAAALMVSSIIVSMSGQPPDVPSNR